MVTGSGVAGYSQCVPQESSADDNVSRISRVTADRSENGTRMRPTTQLSRPQSQRGGPKTTQPTRTVFLDPCEQFV